MCMGSFLACAKPFLQNKFLVQSFLLPKETETWDFLTAPYSIMTIWKERLMGDAWPVRWTFLKGSKWQSLGNVGSGTVFRQRLIDSSLQWLSWVWMSFPELYMVTFPRQKLLEITVTVHTLTTSTHTVHKNTSADLTADSRQYLEKLAPSSSHSKCSSISWLCFYTCVQAAAMCCTYIRSCPFKIFGSTLFGLKCASSSCCLFPSPSLPVFLQENLRQLIMIPLPNVLLLGRTPYCGMLFYSSSLLSSGAAESVCGWKPD